MSNKTLNQYVSDFSKHINNAIAAIENAAKQYAEAMHKFAETAQVEFSKAYPHVTANTWEKLLAIGNGDAAPQIMLFSDKFAKKLVRMPVGVQREVLNGDSFDYFNPTTRTVSKVSYGEITSTHERILFDEGRSAIRTIPEQVAYANVIAASKKQYNRNYTVKTDRIVVHCACEISKTELESAIEEME